MIVQNSITKEIDRVTAVVPTPWGFVYEFKGEYISPQLVYELNEQETKDLSKLN